MNNYESIPINLQGGEKVRFEESTPEQVKWGSNDDPKKFLKRGEVYTIEKLEVHSQHTKVILQECLGKKFNSVSFSLA